MKVKVTGLIICDGTVEAKDVKVDYQDTLELYIMRNIIGMKSSWNTRYYRE